MDAPFIPCPISNTLTLRVYHLMAISLLRGHSITLRPLTPQDAPALFSYARNKQVTRFTSWQRHTSINTTYSFVRNIKQKGSCLWAITTNDTHALIGECGFIVHNNVADIHCTLAPNYWGKGYAHQALTLLIDYCCTAYHVDAIQASIIPENVRSSRLAQHLGMVHTTTFEQQWYAHSRLYDIHLYELK